LAREKKVPKVADEKEKKMRTLTTQSRSPFTNKVVGEYAYDDPTNTDFILQELLQGQGTWAALPLASRILELRKFKERLSENAENLSRMLSLEMGKPLRDSRLEIKKSLSLFSFYEEISEKALSPQSLSFDKGRAEVFLQPLGVILGIMPWNFPVWQALRLAIPNLYLGNGILIKPAGNVVGAAKILESCALQSFSGLVFKNVIVDQDETARIIADKRISGVSLTGSSRAGRSVAELAGRHLKKCVLELGGSDPYLVMEDADLDLAAKKCAQSRLLNSGQSCISAKRLIVDNKVFDAFLPKLKREFESYQIGDPMDESTQLGPLAREDLVDNLQKQVSESLRKGAKEYWKSATTLETPCYFPPTILSEVTPDHRAFSEELFGPVVAVIRSQTEEEMIGLANQSSYGLGAAIFSKSEERARVFARDRLQTGMVAINDLLSSRAEIPFGGIKESGFGRELGEDALREFANIKSIVLR
jgi:succinate-semialdehyde dehydrogenase/glutarate-semialdehyde dehydrogenase